ncbi:MAG TPA: NAD(P)-dependent oxidoreductase [Treponema sp.]|nr:MAG: hypothetical protein A2Y36_15915 [Treponema sp. GWA1_62_8]OHE67212.1 MAG: hypothetical protein A2001_05040 [Treponema sp. GWC1_61_84]OHE74617.1 MAG: hypothetical protein A2413_19140 [Treponema sp. RIFOXYC1_FULL_61_9]HCM28479.1 NAD(P)-dependent oxidoreductase [Treponema sp.]
MKVLILGASGTTGKLVARQLLERKINVRLVVREGAILPVEILADPLVEIVKGNVSEFDDSRLTAILEGCGAVVSCLGHTVSLKGMFGKPRNLVSGTIKNICGIAGKQDGKKVKLILMSTTAYTNSVSGEKNTLGERIALSVFALLLPAHRDNVKAADYLRDEIGKVDEKIEWIAVRPDTLVNDESESPFHACESPVRSPVFDAGKTTRINVSRFMSDLLLDEALWNEWRCRMPVLYNQPQEPAKVR